MEPLIIVGAGGNTRVILDMIALGGRYEVRGVLDDNPARVGQEIMGAPILGGRALLGDLRAEGVRLAVVGVGAARSTELRNRIYRELLEAGFTAPPIIHPSAIIAPSATVGPGALIMASVTINPCATIGQNVLINTGSVVEHDCRIEDGAFLGPRVALAGNTTVGEGAFVGIGAVTIQGVTLGAGALIAAGAVVTRDVPPAHFARGVPATCSPLAG